MAARAQTITTSTTAQRVTLDQAWPALEITNHDDTDLIWYSFAGDASASGDNCGVVLPQRSKVIAAPMDANGRSSVSVVASANTPLCTVEGMN